METKNVEWNIIAGPDGKIPNDQVTHALLMDVRKIARSIRAMMIFFTVVTVIGIVGAFLYAVANH